MERQRVLYSAKTKTSKVIPTSSTRRPLSLPTSFPAGEHPAPLASVEPDVSVITKRERDYPKSTHISAQTQRPTSLTDNYDERAPNKDIAVWKRDSSNKELVRSAPARSTIKVRNSKICDVPKYNSTYRANQKSHRPRSEGVTDKSLSDKDIFQMGIGSGNDLSIVSSNIHQSLKNESSRNGKQTSSTTLERSTETRKKQTDSVSTTNADSHSYAHRKDVQKTAPPVAPKPKNSSKVSAMNVSAINVAATHSKLSNASVLESSPVVIRKEGHASSKENHIVPSPSPQDSGKTSKPYSGRAHFNQKFEQEYSQSNNSASSLTKRSETQCGISECPGKGLLPETMLPVTYSQDENADPPEMYVMSATTTRNPSAASYLTSQYKDQVIQPKCSHRKPLAAICISPNTPTGSAEDINVHSGLSITNDDTARPRHQQDDQNVPKNAMCAIDKASTNNIYTEHLSPDEYSHRLVDGFKPSWKRNSLRLATQGYSSMSDLTESLECFNGREEDVPKSANSPGYSAHTDTRIIAATHPEKASSVGKMSETTDPDSDRHECKKTSNEVSLNIEEVEQSLADCETLNGSVCNENSLVAMVRNGTHRLSYRMATSGIPDAWPQEAEVCVQANSKKLSPVTERADGDKRSAHFNLEAEAPTDSRSARVAPNIQHVSNTTYSSNTRLVPCSQRSDANIAQLDTHEDGERESRTKRWSYLQATTASISDLTFLDSGLDYSDSSIPYDSADFKQDISNSATSHSHRSKHMTELHYWQTKSTSCYNSAGHHSSNHNCSETSNGNYKSGQKTISPESTNGNYLPKELKVSTSRHGPRSVPFDVSDADSSDSGNTSCYYSASPDTSFVTADGDTLNSVHSHDSRQWSPGQPSLQQRPRSASQPHGDQLSLRCSSQAFAPQRPTLNDQNKGSLSTQDRRPSKLHFHGDRSHDRLSQNQHPTALPSPGQRETSQRLSPRDPKSVSASNKTSQQLSPHDPKSVSASNKTSQQLSPHDPKSVSTNNNLQQQHSRHNTNNNTLSREENSISQNTKGPKHSTPINNVLQCYGCGLNERHSAQTQPYINANNSRTILKVGRNRDINSTSQRRHPEDLRKTANIPSERSHFLHPTSLPGNLPLRIRKCPAGTDFLLKDQSSTSGIPSTPSFSSISSFADDMAWGITPRFPPSLGRPRRKLYAGFDSQPLPMDSFISDSSSVFSIQSCGSWGASRSVEVESSCKLLEVTPSMRSVSSIAYGSSRSLTDKDDPAFLADSKRLNFYNLYPHFNNPAIEDCLKDTFHGKNFSRESLESFLSDATTIGDNVDQTSDFVKLSTDYSSNNGVQHKNAIVAESKHRSQEQCRLDRLDNSCGSVLENVGGRFSGGNLNDNTHPQDVWRASSRVTTAKSRPIPKGKYLFSKDILDLILTPEKTSKKENGTLERQAQKVCEVILCCNEVEMQPAREYHF
ncbi:hypothetical protein BsWGS_03102 [Bradybaena similaris]